MYTVTILSGHVVIYERTEATYEVGTPATARWAAMTAVVNHIAPINGTLTYIVRKQGNCWIGEL